MATVAVSWKGDRPFSQSFEKREKAGVEEREAGVCKYVSLSLSDHVFHSLHDCVPDN